MPRIPADAQVTIVFAQNRDAVVAAELPRPYVAVLPDPEQFNDFGRIYLARMMCAGLDGPPTIFRFRLMVRGFNRTSDAMAEILGGADIRPIAEVQPEFATLLPQRDQYRQIVSKLGFEAAIASLRRLGDAVVVKIEDQDQPRLELIRSRDFHLGIIRAGGAFSALKRGSRYFRQVMPRDVQDAAHGQLRFTAQLRSAQNRYELDLDFGEDPIFKTRTNVLIGKNGTGKTQLLKAMIDALTTADPNRPADNAPAFDPPLEVSRVIVFSSVPYDPFPKQIGAWLGIDYEHFAVNYAERDRPDTLLESLVTCVRDDDDRRLAQVENDDDRIDILRNGLTAIGIWHQIYLPLVPPEADEGLPHEVEIEGRHYFPIGRRLGEQNTLFLLQRIDWNRMPIVLDGDLQVRALSSGEISLVRLTAQLVASIEQGSLLILDEPENHLHPNFVSDIMGLLQYLLEATRSVAIIATHSAYVVREVPRDQVHVLTLEDRDIQIVRPRMQTFGASIDTISQFVFGDTNLTHRYQDRLEAWADEVGQGIGIDAVIAQFGDQLNAESLSIIAERLKQNDAGN
ncbi:AAA family ATPase [Sinorhizobium meliloti]|nr:AAA family ATPase [Sinorhizobium meliloti]MDX0261253.1 AAA family ATPase [Sinorhizobium meliloti]MDX0348613.1 AAA family ATPase [Sinorhizobium meliloti]